MLPIRILDTETAIDIAIPKMRKAKREKNNDDVVMCVEKHGNNDTGSYDTDTAPVGCISYIQYCKPMRFDLFSELPCPALVYVTCPIICVKVCRD